MVMTSILAALVIMAASLVGVAFVGKRQSVWLKRNLRYLTTLSAGVFLAITFSLVSEVLHEGEISIILMLVFIALGAVIVELLSRLIPKAHHHHAGYDHDAHPHDHLDARRMLLGDAMHNIGDGLILVPAFLVDFHVGIFTALAIFIHELVQEISEFFVLREAGYSAREALKKNFFVSSSILLGVALSLIATSFESLEAPLLCFSAGGFLYIVFRDLFPHAARSIRKEKSSAMTHVAVGLIGIAIILLVNAALPHGHAENEESHDSAS